MWEYLSGEFLRGEGGAGGAKVSCGKRMAKKCVFNLVPCDNEVEKEFAKFLGDADDVVRFSKLPEQFGFSIEYMDNSGNLRYYEPDFVAVTQDGKHHLIETKGLEDVNVANKDRAAHLWAGNATTLTKTPWGYLKVRQGEFSRLEPSVFSDLLALELGNRE